MKISVIILIYKNNNKNNIENYRYLYIIPQFSKSIEQIIKKRIDNFIGKHNIITYNQGGFKKNQKITCDIYI